MNIILSLAVLSNCQICSEKLCIAIKRWSRSTDAEQAVPAKNILAAIREMGEEAGAYKVQINVPLAALVTATPRASPVPPPPTRWVRSGTGWLPGANQQAVVHAAPVTPAPLVVKPPSAKKTIVDKRPTTPSVKSATLGLQTLPPIEDDKAESKEQTGGIVCRVGDKATPVFISYQSAFAESVLKIKHAMEARGIPCWMAAEKLVGKMQNAIGLALRVEPAIIICFSDSYRQSM